MRPTGLIPAGSFIDLMQKERERRGVQAKSSLMNIFDGIEFLFEVQNFI